MAKKVRSSFSELLDVAQQNEKKFHKEEQNIVINSEVVKPQEEKKEIVVEEPTTATVEPEKKVEVVAPVESPAPVAENTAKEVVGSGTVKELIAKEIEMKNLDFIRIPANLHTALKNFSSVSKVPMSKLASLIIEEYLTTHKKEISKMASEFTKSLLS